MAQIIKAEIDGVEQSFESLKVGDEGLTTHMLWAGDIHPAAEFRGNLRGERLRLIRKRHTQGNVVYEETGEKRRPQEGERYLVEAQVHFEYGPSNRLETSYRIVKPIGIISDDGKTLHRNDGTSEAVE